jgi:DNA-binding NarL/FixJ family response regulator
MEKYGQTLTPKEGDVVRLVSKGKSRKEIAYELGVAKGTVDTHFKRIFLKLQTRSMVETALWAIRNGFQ